MQLVRASVDVRASVADALRQWSERSGSAPSLPGGTASGTVAFRPLNEAESRVTVHLQVGRAVCDPTTGFIERARRELEQDLRVFKCLLEGGEQARPRENRGAR